MEKKSEEKDSKEEKINETLIRMDSIIKDINTIKEEYINFEKSLSYFFENNPNCFISLLEGVKTFTDWTEKNNYFAQGEFKKVFEPFLNFYRRINDTISNSKFMIKINQLKRDIEEISKKKIIPAKIEDKNKSQSLIDFDIHDIHESNEEKTNNSSNSEDIENPFSYEAKEIELMKNFSYLNNENDQNSSIINNTNNNTIILNCQNIDENSNINNDNNAKYIKKCSDCRLNEATFGCILHGDYFCQNCSDILEKIEKGKHIFQKIQNYEKSKSIESIINYIKHYLLKYNYILELHLSKFPLLEDISNFESQKKFLNEINSLCPFTINPQKGDKINGELIEKLNTMLNIDISDEIVDNNCSLFSNEKFDKKLKEEFDKIKNKLFYFITVIPKENLNIDSDVNDIIIENIKNTYKKNFIDRTNIFILINDKINSFVKSRDFYELHYTYFHIDNPIYNQFIELKILSDEFLCEFCKIEKIFFDYRGNTINPNSSNNVIRGTEIYDPPYGWIGIGLNVLGKYDNGNDEWLTNNTDSSEWAIAYHAINPKNESFVIKILQYIILTKNLDKAISKIRYDSNDKRHWGKIGEGIYLIPKIEIAEQYTGVISFKNKKYKVLLMAKVYIKGIREPENSYFWVLDNKHIRIYRILFKEI